MIQEKNIKPVKILCNTCQYLTRDRHKKFICEAFPQGIPFVILTGTFVHTKLFPKQGSAVVYKEKEKP